MSTSVADFNKTVGALVNRLEKKSRSEVDIANLDRLKRRIRLLKGTLGDSALIDNSRTFFIEYAERILEPDVEKRNKFINELDVRQEILAKGGVVDQKDEFIFSLVDSIRTHYNRAQQKERDEVYTEVNFLLTCVLEYSINL